MRETVKKYIAFALVAGFFFLGGLIAGGYAAIEWVVNTAVKFLNSDNGAAMLFNILKLKSLPSNVGLDNVSVYG